MGTSPVQVQGDAAREPVRCGLPGRGRSRRLSKGSWQESWQGWGLWGRLPSSLPCLPTSSRPRAPRGAASRSASSTRARAALECMLSVAVSSAGTRELLGSDGGLEDAEAQRRMHAYGSSGGGAAEPPQSCADCWVRGRGLRTKHGKGCPKITAVGRAAKGREELGEEAVQSRP